MKKSKIALLCLTLCLAALFGCAKEAEESIPKGWVEYDLPDAGIRIALPPHYVAAAEGLTPTDADYERAGFDEGERESVDKMFSRVLGEPYVSFCIISAKTLGGGIIAMGDAPEDVQALGEDTTNAVNVKRYAEIIYEAYKDKNYEMDYYGYAGSLIGNQMCFAIFEIDYTKNEEESGYTRKYIALFDGEKVELQLAVSKEYADNDQTSEFDDIAKTFQIY